MKPRNVKQAFEQDFVVKSIYNQVGVKIRVDFKRRFHKDDKPDFCSFWINRKYFVNNYPNISASYAI